MYEHPPHQLHKTLVVSFAWNSDRSCAAMISAAAADNSTEYQVAQRWPLTGPGGSGFLLVSEKDHRLYISRDTQVTVIDTNDGKTIGEMRDLTDVRGIAIDSDGKVGYIGDGIGGTLKVFSVPMLRVTFSIKIGGTPDAVVVEPVSRRVFVFDSHNKLAVVLDPASLQVIATVKLPGRPGAAMADGNGSVFVNLVSTSQIAQIDARTLNAPKLVSLNPCVGPSGMALDAAHSRVFSTCDFPVPILIVQHIATGFLPGMVEWLAGTSRIPLKIAARGETALPGHAYVAPDGFQMGIENSGKIFLSNEALEYGVRPSTSYLFRSVATSYGRNAVGILLTGMGRDGAYEMKLLKDCGALTIVQDRETSVIYGMPAAAVELGAAHYVLSPEQIVATLARMTKRDESA